MSRPVVRGSDKDDAELKEWIKQGKKLLTKSKYKRYDRDVLLSLFELASAASADSMRNAYYRLEQSVKGR
jgi:hypothetical protein